MSQRSKQRSTAAAATTGLANPPLAAQAPALLPAQRARRNLGGERVASREFAATGELGGHPIFEPHANPHDTDPMSEKTTKTTETANVPGHDKKVETHTEEVRHQPDTKVETKTESTEQKPQ